MRVWRAAEHRRMPWRNGAGITHEVAMSPESSGTSFDWRISFADVDTGGAFSSFAGVDRIIVIVEGAEMVLTIDGNRHIRRPHRALSFAGESTTTCELPAGPTRCLNVMTRRGLFEASVDVREVAAPARISAAGADPLALVAVGGRLHVTSADGEAVTLATRDVVASVGASALSVDGPGTAAVVRLVPAQPGHRLAGTVIPLAKGQAHGSATVEAGVRRALPAFVAAHGTIHLHVMDPATGEAQAHEVVITPQRRTVSVDLSTGSLQHK